MAFMVTFVVLVVHSELAAIVTSSVASQKGKHLLKLHNKWQMKILLNEDTFSLIRWPFAVHLFFGSGRAN